MNRQDRYGCGYGLGPGRSYGVWGWRASDWLEWVTIKRIYKPFRFQRDRSVNAWRCTIDHKIGLFLLRKTYRVQCTVLSEVFRHTMVYFIHMIWFQVSLLYVSSRTRYLLLQILHWLALTVHSDLIWSDRVRVDGLIRFLLMQVHPVPFPFERAQQLHSQMPYLPSALLLSSPLRRRRGSWERKR